MSTKLTIGWNNKRKKKKEKEKRRENLVGEGPGGGNPGQRKWIGEKVLWKQPAGQTSVIKGLLMLREKKIIKKGQNKTVNFNQNHK